MWRERTTGITKSRRGETVSLAHQPQCLTVEQEIQNNGVGSEQAAEGSEGLSRQPER